MNYIYIYIYNIASTLSRHGGVLDRGAGRAQGGEVVDDVVVARPGPRLETMDYYSYLYYYSYSSITNSLNYYCYRYVIIYICCPRRRSYKQYII